VAQFHMSLKVISRSAGRSATAAAAYRAGEKIMDARTGEVHDYSRKSGVMASRLIMPGGCSEDRATFWNRVELHHKRGDATLAREFTLALPYEMDETAREKLTFDYGRELADRYSVAVDVAIHRPDTHKGSDVRNYHAHVLMSACAVAPSGALGKKAVNLDPIHCQKHRIANFADRERPRWAELHNERMANNGRGERIDHRSLVAQGIDRDPTRHLGPTVTEMLRRSRPSAVFDRIEAEATARRLEAAKAEGERERAISAAERRVIDAETDLRAALAERNNHELDHERRYHRHPATIEPHFGEPARQIAEHNSLLKLSERRLANRDGKHRGAGLLQTDARSGRRAPDELRWPELNLAAVQAEREALARRQAEARQTAQIMQKLVDSGRLTDKHMDEAVQLVSKAIEGVGDDVLLRTRLEALRDHLKARQAAAQQAEQAKTQAIIAEPRERLATSHVAQQQQAERVRLEAVAQQQAAETRMQQSLPKADALLGAAAAIAASPNLDIGAREKAWVQQETRHIPPSQAVSAEAERLRERETARFAVRAAVAEGLISKDEGRALGLFPSEVEAIKDRPPGEVAAAAKRVQQAIEKQPGHPLAELRRALAEAISEGDTTKTLSTLAHARNKHGQHLAVSGKPDSAKPGPNTKSATRNGPAPRM
jgi:hypothetical protein